MELLVLFAALFIGFSVILTPCVSMQIQDHSSSLRHQATSRVDEFQFSLPRKLKVQLVDDKALFKGHEVQVFSTSNYKADFPGKLNDKEENKGKGSKGTRQEWMEGTDTSQYFTMDYSHVRRRRPIHNKALPVGP